MAQINIFNNNFQYTASYIYSRDSKGVFHFALARKVPPGSRIRLGKNINKNSGAAGTKQKYHGKWGTFGGKKDPKSKHTLDAAIREIIDEAGINGLSYKNVDIVWLKRKLTAPLTLEITTVKNGVAIFIFKMNDYNLFQTWFPTRTRGGANIVTTSHGEIDLVGSFTMEKIIQKQIEEMRRFGNNFFLSYALESFNMIVFPYIRSISSSFQKKWSQNIDYLIDNNPRQVYRPCRYIEGPIGKYK